ncbi:MAG: hypothetical protein ABFR47_02165 [Verrucomicrobiota bacterium]
MLRFMRIAGMLIFAVLIGLVARQLQELYEGGTLFERYNNQRKADITLLVVSVCGLAVLSFFELRGSRSRSGRRRGYGFDSKKSEPSEVDGLDSTCIYVAPKTVDAWDGRRKHVSRSRHKPKREAAGVWTSLLRIYCGVLSAFYLGVLIAYLFFWLPDGLGSLVFSIISPVLLFGSAMTFIGVLRKKSWGINFGYAMAIFHLLIFPIGTAAGLLMLLCVVGATPQFVVPERERQRKAIAKRRRKQAVA